MEENATPMPTQEGEIAEVKMNFPEAMKKIIEGKIVTRKEWKNNDYCLLRDGWLCIFTKGDFHTWSVNDGDMEGGDWVVVNTND